MQNNRKIIGGIYAEESSQGVFSLVGKLHGSNKKFILSANYKKRSDEDPDFLLVEKTSEYSQDDIATLRFIQNVLNDAINQRN